MTRQPGGAGRRPRLPGARILALGLIAAGLAVCALPFGLAAYGGWQERQLTERWENDLRRAPAQVAPAAAAAGVQPAAQQPHAMPDGIAFAMRVPRVHYYAAVREGVSLDVLGAGPGHYQATAWPGQDGAVGIAAHNTFWLPFGDLGPGDQIDLETRYGTFHYRITGTRVVSPTDVAVLRPAPDRQLVLTTCWPLWAGSLAQQRLAIFARQV